MSNTPRTDFVAHAFAWANGAKDKIVQLERELAEARGQLHLCNVDQFTTAAELAEAVTKERERCAKVCEEFYSVENVAQKCAEAIRKGE